MSGRCEVCRDTYPHCQACLERHAYEAGRRKARTAPTRRPHVPSQYATATGAAWLRGYRDELAEAATEVG